MKINTDNLDVTKPEDWDKVYQMIRQEMKSIGIEINIFEKELSLKESFNNAWNRFDLKEKIFVIFAFLVSLGFTLYGMIPTLFQETLTSYMSSQLSCLSLVLLGHGH